MIVHKHEFIIIILYHVRLRIRFVKLNVVWPSLLYMAVPRGCASLGICAL